MYAVFNNHKNGDFKPYILKSTNFGKSWISHAGDLPARGTVYTLAEDHVDKDLLFCGTEFGAYFSVNGGKNWVELANGLPTIAVKDMAIQQRENDLVIATFGRGFYVLDDYSCLRDVDSELFKQPAHMFAIKDALAYIESNPLGLTGIGSQGASHYAADNPPFGVVFTYYIKDEIKSPRELRRNQEAKRKKAGEDNAYPSIDQLRQEDLSTEPYLMCVISDAANRPLRKIRLEPAIGVQRVVWNLRTSTTTPVKLNERKPGRYESADDGYMVPPGEYQVALYKVENDKPELIIPNQKFKVNGLENTIIPAHKEALASFLKEVSELRRRVRGATDLANETKTRLKHVRAAVEKVPVVPLELLEKVSEYEKVLHDFNVAMWGDNSLSSREFETKDGLASRIELIVWTQWHSTSAPTSTSREAYKIVQEEFQSQLDRLHQAIKGVEDLEKRLDSYASPYTPGRGERWRED